MLVYVDIETYSTEDIRNVSVHRYSEDPDFQILMAAWSVNGRPVWTTVDQDTILSTFQHYRDKGATFVAHNAQFERVCFSAALGELYLAPELFHDTAAVAAEKGMPRSLDKLAKFLGTTEKDSAGTRLINLFCKPGKNGRVKPEDRPGDWLDFIDYCEQDVETLIAVHDRIGDFPTEREREIFMTDQRINDRGILADMDMVSAACHSAANSRVQHGAEMRELTGISNENSTQQLVTWFQENYSPSVDNVRAETVRELQGVVTDPTVHRVLELRQLLALTTPKKYEAIYTNANQDDRVRGAFRFYGAHTGRWGSRGVQLHNLASAQFKEEVDEQLAIEELKGGDDLTMPELKKLIRASFVGPYTVSDFSAIEARVIAWLAGEQWALDAFRAGEDIYISAAERMGGMTRFQGKVATLALGYGGAIGSMRSMGGDSLRMDENGTLDHDGAYPADDDALYTVVSRWRHSNKNIVRFWGLVEQMFVQGGWVGDHIYVEKDRSSRWVWLPSGRFIAYHRCHSKGKEISYVDHKGVRVKAWGGMLAENVTQAVARDILGDAMVRLEENGFRTVAHVHDEVVVEGIHNSVEDTVKEVPEWASGLPIEADSFTALRYRKG